MMTKMGGVDLDEGINVKRGKTKIEKGRVRGWWGGGMVDWRTAWLFRT